MAKTKTAKTMIKPIIKAGKPLGKIKMPKASKKKGGY